MSPDELTKLASESTKYDNISTFLGVLNICLVILTAFVTIATFYYGNKLSGIKEKIANEKIAESNAKAAIANEQAALANLKAQSASATAEIAKVESASANIVATEAKNKQTELAIDLADAKIKQAIAQKENANAQLALNKKIEEDRKKALPRLLTQSQKRDMMALLKQVPVPEKKIEIVINIGDKEAQNYALEFSEILTAANWTTALGAGQAMYTQDPIGLFICIKNTQNPPPHAIILQKIFTKIGLSAPGWIDSSMADDAVTILVGHKP